MDLSIKYFFQYNFYLKGKIMNDEWRKLMMLYFLTVLTGFSTCGNGD